MMMLGSGLKAQGQSVAYLTFSGRGAGPALRELGEQVFEAPVRAKIDPFGILKMAKIMRSQSFDIVHTHLSTSSTNGALAARLAKIPSVATVHGMSGRLSFVFANQLIAVSEEVKQHLIRQGTAAKKVTVVHNGINFPEVDPEALKAIRAEWHLEGAFPVIGTVARVTPLKGIEFAIEAMVRIRERFPTAVYLVLGDGDGLEACKRLAQSLGLGDAVRFLGYRSPVEPYVAAMDLLAFPSLKEAMGIALVEAAGQGVPAVASAVGGIPEVVTPEVGLLVPPRDSHALAEGLLALASDDRLRQRMSEAARSRARSLFSQEAMVSSTLQVYAVLISRNRSRQSA
jgi:glycosyltransferase involved in cell wall biosynthesis